MNVVKKVFFIALMIWLLFSISSYAATATVSTDAVRLRREASVESDVITIVYNNEEVTLIEQQGDWYKVKYNEYTGFIRADLLNLPEQPVEEPVNTQEPLKEEIPTEQPIEENNQIEVPENTTTQKVVSVNTALRIIPSIAASKIDEITAGSVVTVIQVKNNWTCIDVNGKSAWVPSTVLVDKTEEPVPEEKPEEVIKTMYVNVSSANVRLDATTSSVVLVTITKNTMVEVLEDLSDWYKIKINEQIGYISKPLLSNEEVITTSRSIEEPRNEEPAEEVQEQSIEEPQEQYLPEQAETVIKSVYVNVEKANLRTEASTTSDVVSSANRKDKLDVLNEENGWYKVKLTDQNAYIRQDLVVNTLEEVVVPTAPVVENASVGNTSTQTGEAIVAYAKQFLGCRYVYGGAGPSSFDCSGFTQYVYKNFGIYLSHSAVTQASNGVYVEKANLQLGDLIIFRDWDNKSIGHCGIYIGNSKFIHAANPSRGVVTDTFASGYYYERYVSARRLF